MSTKNELLIDFDDYEQTVHMCAALKFLFNDKLAARMKLFSIGRPMQVDFMTEKVTPDTVVQLGESYGVIGEIKKAISKNDDFVVKNDIAQIGKYDKICGGWRTNDGTIENFDVFWFVHSKAIRKFTTLLRNNQKDDAFRKFYFTTNINGSEENHKIELSHNLALFRWARIEERNIYYQMNLECGSVSDAEVLKTFEDAIVDIEDIVDCASEIQFTDDKPPIVYLLTILWSHVLNTLFEQSKFTEKIMESNRKSLQMEITIGDVFDKVKNAFMPLDGDYKTLQIRESWIKEAFISLEKLKLAKPLGNGRYLLTYKTLPNPKTYFVEKLRDDVDVAPQQERVSTFTKAGQKT